METRLDMDTTNEITPQALRSVLDNLLAAYGPQRWWPVQDADNPRFEILVGAMLTQHTAWTNVERAIGRLCTAGTLTPQALLRHDDLPALIRSAGAHNIKAARLHALCEWFIAAGGFAALERRDTASLREELLSVGGVGEETADAILVYAFGRPLFIADAYAFRIFERYGWHTGTRRYARLRRTVEAAGPADDVAFYAELHALIVAHAKNRCHKRRPDCGACVLAPHCEYATAQE